MSNFKYNKVKIENISILHKETEYMNSNACKTPTITTSIEIKRIFRNIVKFITDYYQLEFLLFFKINHQASNGSWITHFEDRTIEFPFTSLITNSIISSHNFIFTLPHYRTQTSLHFFYNHEYQI